MKDIKVIFLKKSFAIAKINTINLELINLLSSRNSFFCFCSDEDEKSLICEESQLPDSIECSRSWSAIKIVGPIPFESYGILKKILEPIADAKCSALVISTFSTDYLFFKSEKLEIITEAISKMVTIVV